MASNCADFGLLTKLGSNHMKIVKVSSSQDWQHPHLWSLLGLYFIFTFAEGTLLSSRNLVSYYATPPGLWILQSSSLCAIDSQCSFMVPHFRRQL
jgi:hypothetical protein